MKRNIVMVVLAVFVFAVVLLGPGRSAYCDSARDLVSRGNDEYRGGNFKQAIEFYDRASVREPESAIIFFNLGDAYYKEGDYGKAFELFEKAAMKSTELSLDARAWYNMGNCAFQEGDRQLDSDMEKALQSYRESVELYYTALEKDTTLVEAKHNMELARLKIKDLLDRINKQEKDREKYQREMKAIVDSLIALVQREKKAVDESVRLDKDQNISPQELGSEMGKARDEQESIEHGTADLINRLNKINKEQEAAAVKEAISHLDTSIAHQGDAIQDLDKSLAGEASSDQQSALEQMRRALKKLTEGSNKNRGEKQKQEERQRSAEQQNQGEKQKSREQQHRKREQETARAILDEERENKQRRARAAVQNYSQVEKDW
jgi:Ca-activated chloride channel family protein